MCCLCQQHHSYSELTTKRHKTIELLCWAGHKMDLDVSVSSWRYTHISPMSFLKPSSLLIWILLLFLLLSGACFLISSNNALISWRWGLCRMETPRAIVPPKWFRSGWSGSCADCCLSWSSWHGQSWCARQSCLAPFLCLSCNLTALEERVKGRGPEGRLEPDWLEGI